MCPPQTYPMGTLTLGSRTLTYTLRESARAVRPRVWVSPATGVVVTLPRGRSAWGLEAFLRRHDRWILRQLERLERAAVGRPRPWPYGTMLSYLGQSHAVCIEPAARNGVRRIPERELIVSMRAPGIEGARRVLRRWLIEEARRLLGGRVGALGRQMGLTARRVTIRDPRWQWGSCSATGALSFSFRLVMAPREVLDYVAVHELAHLREPNHSTRFWALVARHHADPFRCRAWLRAHGPFLGL